VAPQKDFFYHTLVDMIENYTAQHESQPDDVLQRKIADRVSVMKRTAERLRKLKDDSSSTATSSTSSTAANAAATSPAAAAGASAAAAIAGASVAGATPGPMTVARTSKSKKPRRTTAPVVVPSLARISPLSSSSVASRAEFDARVAGLEFDSNDGPSQDELKTSIVNALSPRSARLAAKQARAAGGDDDDDDGALVVPSRVVNEVIDFVVPPPPPLPGSLRRNADGKLLFETGEPPPPPLPAETPKQPPPPSDDAVRPPPPLPAEGDDGAPGDQFTLPRMRPRPAPEASSTPPLPTAAPAVATAVAAVADATPASPQATSASPQASPAASPAPVAGSLPKPKSATLKKKRDTLRHSPPREADDAKRTNSARPTNAAPLPPSRAKSMTAPLSPAAPSDPAEELKQLKMRLMLAAGAMGTAQQAVATDDSWVNQTALAKAQAEYKELKEKISEAQLRTSTPVVMTKPISGRPANAPLVKLMSSSSTNSVRQRTASIDEMTGHVADLKTAEEVGREEQLLALFGTISLPPPPPLPKDPASPHTSEQSDEMRTSENGAFDSSGSSTPHTTASPAPMPVESKRSSADSVEERGAAVGLQGSSSARSVSVADDGTGATKQRPASSDGADARLLTDARQLKRMYAAQEILETEVRYVACLESMVENYKRELDRSAATNQHAPHGPQPLATTAQIRTMFSNAQAVLNTNRVLLNQVRARVGQWDAHSRLGDVFLRIADFFKIYIEYANNYDAAHEQLDQLIDSSEAFVRFCEAMELRDGLDLGLEDLLIMPVQRLPRYVMLLEALLKYTPAVHPDREALTSAVTKIQEISQQINDTNFEVEQRRRVFEIHQAVTFPPGHTGLAAPHRIFRRDSPATYYDSETSKRRRCHVYLFNDLLLLTNVVAKLSAPASMLAMSSLRTARTARIADQKGVRGGDDITNAMVVIDMQQNTSGGQHVLCLSTPEERDAWLADVDEAKAETIHAMISKSLIK
jgi:hypothetical protein